MTGSDEELLKNIEDVFRSLRPFILERAGNPEYRKFTQKADGSPVTQTDVDVEKKILADLAKNSPGIPVFGEETGYDDDLPATYWLVDPLDGTKNFVEGKPLFTMMGVLIRNEQAVASIIYNPSEDIAYTALKGKGAYRNGVVLDLRKVPLPHVAYCKGRFIESLNEILAQRGVTCQMGFSGGGYEFSQVVDGVTAARFSLLGGGGIHDYAPGALLVQEAHGAVVSFKDDQYTFRTKSFAACHPAIASILQEHAKEIRALEIELA